MFVEDEYEFEFEYEYEYAKTKYRGKPKMIHLAEPSDADRGRLHARRGNVEAILDLAAFLPPADRAIVEQVFARGGSLSHVAPIAGVSTQAMRRRLRSLLRRLRDPHFSALARHPEFFPAAARRSAGLIYFEGLSLRAAAQRRGKSLHAVRRHLRLVHTLATPLITRPAR